jgi:DNA-directed RNA polymerase subunit RPC12/RpoP
VESGLGSVSAVPDAGILSCGDCGKNLAKIGNELICTNCGYTTLAIPEIKEVPRRADMSAVSAEVEEPDPVMTEPGLPGKVHFIVSKLDSPESVRLTADLICGLVLSKNLEKGIEHRILAAAIVYLTYRRLEIVRPLDEIARKMGMLDINDKKDMMHYYETLKDELGIATKPQEPVKFVPRIANRLGTSGAQEIDAVDIAAKLAKTEDFLGKDPMGVAAIAVRMALVLSGDRRARQKDVSEAAGITEVTLRTHEWRVWNVFGAEGVLRPALLGVRRSGAETEAWVKETRTGDWKMVAGKIKQA